MKTRELVKENLDKFLVPGHVTNRNQIVMDKPYFEFICEMIALDANLQGFKQGIDGRF